MSPKAPSGDLEPWDAALETARDMLDGTVCECGHTDSAHVFEPDECHGEAGADCDVKCRQFRPVEFIVERADDARP